MEDSQPNPKAFSVRIVSLDYYMTPPISGFDISYSTFHGGNVKEVPVIRIYGSTPAGQKACLHIHRVLPYLYVPCSDLGCINDDEAGSRLQAISLALEKALKLKGNTGSKRQHVHSCSLVRAKKFYGYHSSEELFMKIYFYYPQDVSRAANLLLAGAILDRVLQPYESHIPFLLQFLINYNLYGMGHLHVSKVKFRYPVPVVFSLMNAKHNGKSKPLTDDSTCMAGDLQSGPDGDICSDLPIWISSSIPDGWIWSCSEQPDSSENKGTALFKRQSTSDLEGDAVVDEIMNQQFISYAPLSQTHSEVRMVQSLVPIWEEEFERTGLPDAMPSDSGKPGPRDVLKILADGIEFDKFMEVKNAGEEFFTPKSLENTPCGNLLDNLERSNCSPSKYMNTSDIVGSLLSLGSTSQNVDAADRLQVSDSEVPSNAKASDEDALRLLKWLASSQAAEDINSDDELARETILSPLLPSKTIDKVIEKANVDYESESQQECQDILDSVDMFNLEELNGGASNPEKYNRSSKASLSNVIPQLDGSSDDPESTPFADKSMKTDKSETNPSKEIHSCPEQNSNLTCKRRRKRPRMGSLPVFSRKMSNVSQCNTHSTSHGHENEKRGNFGTSLFGSEAETITRTLKFEEEKDISDKEVNTVVECSTRDLMRRKRRIEQFGHASLVEDQKTESCFDVKCQKRYGNIENEETECHQRNITSILKPTNETSLVKSIHSSFPTSGNMPLSPSKGCIESGTMPNSENQETVVPFYHGDGHLSENRDRYFTYDSSLHVDSPIPECSYFSENENNGEDFGCKDLLQAKSRSSYPVPSNLDETSKNDCTGGSQCQGSNYTCKGTDVLSEHCNNTENEPKLLQVCNSISESINKIPEPVKLIGMTFSQKPPVIEWTDELDGEAPLLAVDMGTGAGTSFNGRSSDDCLPFFTRNFLEEKEHQGVSPEESEFIDNRERLKGIPTLYQNDGSCLFMLTPAVSPPSRESVDKWLSFDKSIILGHKLDSELPFHPISNENVDSQNSQPDDNNQSRHHKREVKTPHETKEKPSTSFSQDASQISGPERKTRQTPLSQIGFRDPASVGEGQQLTLVSVEVQSESRGDLRPDPRFDAINFIVLIFQEDDKSKIDAHVLLRCDSACAKKNLDSISECEALIFTEELDLLNYFIKVIRTTDPDILMGWDVQSGSLGYLAERAAHLGLGFLNKISRTPSEPNVASGDSSVSEKEMGIENLSDSVTAEAVLQNAVIEDEWGRTHASGVHVGGRIVLNVWRLMRNEVKLNMYTSEAVAEAVLRRKIPFIHWKVLSKWFTSGPSRARYRAIEYVLERAKLNLQIMSQLDMINRTSELARVFGIDFFSVLSRGSQYRVESMFLRLAHTQNYLAISPGSRQVASQPAMECLPLVMEPESNFYADPVIVLDFQSLYPSMVIAYNLCFCTCLGKITRPDILGVSSYSPDGNIFQNLKNDLLFTPNGVAYVPSNVRKGILPRLLEEILSTRIMVKQAMKKLTPSQQVLHRILNARQLALKLIANVTYGYTAAGFSGRMPCAELADSIVQCGRRTLETAISFVNSNDKWKAKVIYGDTDSMFVLLKRRSLKEAFAIGREIASAISEMNPAPVTLKMEKVYYPCFLLTKKRYVGYSYESPDQLKPVFDAKGIETVRRDTCAAVSKTLEQTLRIYFEGQDIDKVKAYLVRQWSRILSGRVSLQDFVFAKEVRLGTYSSRASSLPPAAIVATKAMRADPRAEPRYAERVPYVVVHGEPGSRLVDMVVNPLDLLVLDSPFRLNDIYYIRKQIIPALQRVFGLVRADLNQWFLEMPRPGLKAVGKSHSLVPNPRKTRIDYYYLSKHCILCGELVQSSAHVCQNCSKDESVVAAALTLRTSKLEKEIHHIAAICRHCGGGDWKIESGVKCISLACSVFYERRKVQKELQSLSEVTTRTGFYPKCMVEWF